MTKFLSNFAFLTFLSIAIVSCSKKDSPTQSGGDTGTTLNSFKLASDADAPGVDPANVEAIWNSATAISTTVSPMGDNFTGSTTPFPVTIKSVVSSTDIYFLVQYADASPNYFNQPLHFKGGDPKAALNWTVDATTYEDGVSLIFEDPLHMGKSGTKTFASDGCTMLCHTSPGVFGDKGMFSETDGRYDLWYWHAGKGNGSGYADDKMSIGNPNFGIVEDDINAEIYHNNAINNSPGYFPYVVAGGSNRNLDKQYFIAEETAKPFASGITINPGTSKAWTTDDLVAAYSLALPADPTNDYFDVKAKGNYSNGAWTVKFQRKLSTGNANDVSFSHGNTYPFSFAVHNNNSPGNHYGAASTEFKLMIP